MDIGRVPGKIGILPEYRRGYRNPPGANGPCWAIRERERGRPRAGSAPPSPCPNWTRRRGAAPPFPSLSLPAFPPPSRSRKGRNPTPTRRRIPPPRRANKGRPASPLLLYIQGQGAPLDTQVDHKDLSQPCAVPPSTIIHLGHTVAVLRRSPATVASSTSSPRHCAD